MGYLIQGSGVGNQYKVMRMMTKMNKKMMMILSLSFHLILGSLFAVLDSIAVSLFVLNWLS